MGSHDIDELYAPTFLNFEVFVNIGLMMAYSGRNYSQRLK